MFDKIIDEIKARNGTLYTGILIIAGCFLIAKFGDKVILIKEALFQSIILFLPHMGSIIFVVVLLVIKKYLFKLSDKKSQEKIDQYNKPLIAESKDNKYFSVKLIEKYEKLDKEYGNTLQIIIKNKSVNRIEYLKGYISLYKNLIKISQVDFEINHMDKYSGEKVYYDFIDHNKLFWDGFDIYVSKIKSKDKVEEDLFYEGNHFIRTHYFLLNIDSFYDYKICGIRSKYNLIWLKEKFRRIIVARIRHSCSRHIIHFRRIPFIQSLKEGFFRLIRISLVIIGTLIVLIGIFLVLFDLGNMFIDLFHLWKEYFIKIADMV